MKRFILLISTLFILSLAIAQSTNFQKANSLYNKGKYEQSVSLYEDMISTDKHASSLYFNIGNCYFKMNKLPEAILNYERAKLLSPSDRDINENLIFANSLISDKIDAKPQYFIIKWVRKLINIAHSNSWAYICCGLWILVFILLFLFKKSKNTNLRKALFPFIIIVFSLSIFSLYSSYIQYNSAKNNPYAIVFSSSETIRSTPSINGTELFLLHEGTKVKVLEKVGTWYNIELSDERQGWIPTKAVQKIHNDI